MFSLTLIWLLLVALASKVDAAQVIVDDADPAIHYINEFVPGSTCNYCWAHPDPAQAHGGTWHDAYKPSGSTVDGARLFNYTFHGTGVAIYAIVAHGAPVQDPTSGYSSGFIWEIDGTLNGNWNYPVESPTNPPTYAYNVMAASRNDLSDGLHTVTVFLGRNQPSFLFDYLVVTNSDPEPTSSSTSTAASSATTSNSTSSSTSRSSSSTTATNSTSLQTIPSFTLATSSTVDTGVINGSSTNNDSTTTGVSKRLSTGATIGVAIGAISLCVLLLLLLLLWRKRRQEKNERLVSEPTPFDIGKEPGIPMVASFAPMKGLSDSQTTFRDVKAPLPIGDNLVDPQQPMYERRKPDLPPHDGFVNYSHPYGPAYHQHQQQQAMEDEVSDGRNGNQRAPWFQQTEGSHPVEALQQHAPFSPSPHSPLNSYSNPT
ncbi:hypothetical protein CPB86DRAFT_362627 [Serendipita vermifera]|nr:hypothetical protein CPB86DRAFT_362627 [Serendipita vermifera]